MPNYGQNVVINPSGSQDDMGWTMIGATVVSGGTDSNGKCFRLSYTGKMLQNIAFSKQPIDIKINAKFYYSALEQISPMQAYIKCTMHYDDGEIDVHYTPCTGSFLSTVSGIVNGQNKQWVIIESICPINEQKKLVNITLELICDGLSDYGYFDEIQVLPNLGDTTSAIIGEDGQIIVDESGVNPDFVKPSQNVVRNSSFEQFDKDTKVPKYWTAGVSSQDYPAFDGSYVLKLTPGQSTQQTTEAGIDPESWGGGNGRISFYHRGGFLKVEVVRQDGTPLPIFVQEGDNTTFQTIFVNNGSWKRHSFGVDTSSLSPGEKIFIKFTNSSVSDNVYVDAVQLEQDFTGSWPSFYTPGPQEPISGDPQTSFGAIYATNPYTVEIIQPKYQSYTEEITIVDLQWNQTKTGNILIIWSINPYFNKTDIGISWNLYFDEQLIKNSVIDYFFVTDIEPRAFFDVTSSMAFIPNVQAGNHTISLRGRISHWNTNKYYNISIANGKAHVALFMV